MSDGVIRKMCECCGERNCSKEEMQYCKFCGSEDLYTLTEQEDDELERCMDEGFSRHYWKELRRRHVFHSKAFSREEYEAMAKAEEKLIGKEASVYVSIAPSRTGRGKIVLTAQGAYTELDAVTDETERIPVDERVVITEIGADYMVVKRISTVAAEEKEKEEKIQTDDKKDL